MTAGISPPAVLFDVDGTLVDSNYLHVHAWYRAFHAVFVGDAVWDAVACKRAGVTVIGLLSGGVSREELEKAGAQSVFDNPRDLHDNIGDTAISRYATTSC